MQENNWISLMDYSNKYHVSMSTLRRRIKNHDLKYHLKAGKYYLSDTPMTTQPEEEVSNQVPFEKNTDNSDVYLQELKKAYTMVLHEKEEQIQILKEEIADLKTLVSVLETENQRLNSQFR